MATTVSTDLVLGTADGSPTTVGDLLTQPVTIVQLVRYYGCLPCQEWAVEASSVQAELAAEGIGVIAVAGGADYQAAYLRDERGVTIPLLLDPEQRVREAVGAMKSIGLGIVDPRSGLAYLKSMKRGYRQKDLPPKDSMRSPGVVILDAAGEVLWQHIGTYVGDYPAVADVVAAARSFR